LETRQSELKTHIHIVIKMSQTITVSFKATTFNAQINVVTIVLNPAAILNAASHYNGSPATIALSYTGTNGSIYKIDRSIKDRHELMDYLDVLYRWTPDRITIEHQDIRVMHCIEGVLRQVQERRKIINSINSGENCPECGDEDGSCDCDDTDPSTRMDYSDFIDEIKGQITALTCRPAFLKECKVLFASPLIKDKDCPVLMEPLTLGNASVMPCKHVISQTALYRLTAKQEGGKHYYECPMCRDKFSLSSCLSV